MKLGLIARADNTGLGVQTHEFYKHMQPDRTMVVDISQFNGNKQYPERYTQGEIIHVYGFPKNDTVNDFLTGLDVVFLAEAPYNFYLYTRAKELGVKVANQYNYEFFDWFANPDLPKPDMLIAPSKWHYDTVDIFCKTHNIEHVYLHCPVNRNVLPHPDRPLARTFLHIAGRAAAHDRNGTETVIQASKYLTTDAKILIHFQGEQGLAHQATSSLADYLEKASQTGRDNLEIQVNEYNNYADIYNQGDVFVLPRRYGGNCLPLNEALGSGMPAIMTDISPNNQFLPKHWLVDSRKVGEFTPRTTIDIYQADIMALAAKIDRFYKMSEEQFSVETDIAKHLADSISWENLALDYRLELETLCSR